jgi:hypothetical protein
MPGEGKSTEISLKPLVSGEFERIIEIKFESEKAKVGAMGVKIKGIVAEKSKKDGFPTALIILLAFLASDGVLIWIWRKWRR